MSATKQFLQLLLLFRAWCPCNVNGQVWQCFDLVSPKSCEEHCVESENQMCKSAWCSDNNSCGPTQTKLADALTMNITKTPPYFSDDWDASGQATVCDTSQSDCDKSIGRTPCSVACKSQTAGSWNQLCKCGPAPPTHSPTRAPTFDPTPLVQPIPYQGMLLLATGTEPLDEAWNFGVYSNVTNSVYFFPYKADCILIVHAETLEVDSTSICGLQDMASATLRLYSRGVVGPDNKIYIAPCEADHVLVVDPRDDSTKKIMVPTSYDPNFKANSKFGGAVLAQNNKIYLTPRNSGYVAIVDPSDGSIESKTINNDIFPGTMPFPGNKYSQSALSPSGMIISIPSSATQFDTNILIIDPSNNTNLVDLQRISSAEDTAEYCGGVLLASHNMIMAPPRNRNNMLIIHTPSIASSFDVDTTSISNLTTSNNPDKWCGAFEGSDGKFYSIPRSARPVLIVDPVTLTADTTSIDTELMTNATFANKWVGGVMTPSGLLFGVPYTYPDILVVNTRSPDTGNPTVAPTTIPTATPNTQNPTGVSQELCSEVELQGNLQVAEWALAELSTVLHRLRCISLQFLKNQLVIIEFSLIVKVGGDDVDDFGDIVSPVVDIIAKEPGDTAGGGNFTFRLPVNQNAKEVAIRSLQKTFPCAESVVQCEWFDESTDQWSEEGCITELQGGGSTAVCRCTHLTVFSLILRGKQKLTYLCQAQETDYLLLVLYGAVALLSLIQLACLLNNRIKSDSGWQMQVLQHSAIFFICFLRCVSLAAKPVMSSPVLVFASMLPSVLELMLFTFLIALWSSTKTKTGKDNPIKKIQALLKGIVSLLALICIGDAAASSAKALSYLMAALSAITCIACVSSGTSLVWLMQHVAEQTKRMSSSTFSSAPSESEVQRSSLTRRLLKVAVGSGACLGMQAIFWAISVAEGVLDSDASTLAVDFLFHLFNLIPLLLFFSLLCNGTTSLDLRETGGCFAEQ